MLIIIYKMLPSCKLWELQEGGYNELTISSSYYHLRYNFLQEVHSEEMIAYVSISK